MEGTKLTITVEEAAERLGISRGLAYEMVKRGRLPACRFGRRWVVPVRAFEKLLDSATPSAEGPAATSGRG